MTEWNIEGSQMEGDFSNSKDIIFYENLADQRKAGEAYLVTGNLKLETFSRGELYCSSKRDT